MIALQALAHVAADDTRFGRFLDLTGFRLDYVRERAGARDVQTAVLDYLCRNERDLLRFSAEISRDPAVVMSALRALAPDMDWEMTGEKPPRGGKRGNRER